jgi:myosin heavy subunit
LFNLQSPSQPLRENRFKEFERFKKKFDLGSYSKQIASVLDEEPEVSRFYAELVPLQIKPDEFWARLFFRLHLLQRTGSINFEEEDDEEEELVWEDDNVPNEKEIAEEEEVVEQQPIVDHNDSINSQLFEELNQQKQLIQHLQDENSKLTTTNSSMKKQIFTMEQQLNQKDAIIDKLSQEVTQLKHEKEIIQNQENNSPPNPSKANHNSETASVASSDSNQSSLVLVNHSDTGSLYLDEDSRHGEFVHVVKASSNSQSTTKAKPQTKTSTSTITAEAEITSTSNKAMKTSKSPATRSSKIVDTTTNATNTPTPSKSIVSKTTSYIAAVDDEDEEEEGWT